MNRLHHIKETLPKNIIDNINYENLQHVLLDYSSKDELETWVSSYLTEYLKSGRLVYWKYSGADFFKMAHSKNMVIKLARGQIICLVDADNFTGLNYAEYVNNEFDKDQDIFLTTIHTAKNKNTNRIDVMGRVAFKKQDFVKINGFDEYMNNYGFDDSDFCKRLELTGLKRKIISDEKYLDVITHSISERVENIELKKETSAIFVNHINYYLSEILLKKRNGSAFLFNIINQNNLESLSQSNSYYNFKSFTTLRVKIHGHIKNIENKKIQEDISKRFTQINQKEIYDYVIFITSVSLNERKSIKNTTKFERMVNSEGFGNGDVVMKIL